MILAVTGHRPSKLGGYTDEVSNALRLFAIEQIKRLKEEHDIESIISGMALGWDTAIARAARILEIPLIAAIPFRGQEVRWPPHCIDLYNRLLDGSTEVKYVCEPGFAVWKMQKRNEWMIDKGDLLLALWNRSSGGTSNAIRYAIKNSKTIENVWDSWRSFNTLEESPDSEVW